MNSFFVVVLLSSANIILAASLENRTIFRKADALLDVVPTLPIPSIPTMNITFPGTKWCGMNGGNIATNYTDLGAFNNTDVCCRAHQECKEIIKPISSSYSLENPSFFARFSCGCEQQLYNCLKGQDDLASAIFGSTYFGLVEQCFALDHPVVECVEYKKVPLGIGKRCVVYKFDETQEPVYQFFDNALFGLA